MLTIIFEGDRLYQFSQIGPTVTLSTGAPFFERLEVQWSRIQGESTERLSERLTGPQVKVGIVVHDGRPEVDFVAVRRSPESARGFATEITAKALSEIPLREIVDKVVGLAAMVSMRMPPLDGEGGSPAVQEWEEDVSGAADAALMSRHRRTVDDALLRRVADVYKSDMGGAPTKAVSDQLFTSHRNATRWVALARQRGFLAPYGKEDS
jgi:hypothetical protein